MPGADYDELPFIGEAEVKATLPTEEHWFFLESNPKGTILLNTFSQSERIALSCDSLRHFLTLKMEVVMGRAIALVLFCLTFILFFIMLV
jgi:hypothetical protein